jgi:hypothetical protein
LLAFSMVGLSAPSSAAIYVHYARSEREIQLVDDAFGVRTGTDPSRGFARSRDISRRPQPDDLG